MMHLETDEIGKEKKEAGKKDESHDGAQLAGQLARSF